MNTPKRLLSGCDDSSESPTTIRRRFRSPSGELITPIDGEIEQVAKKHRVSSDTVKRIISDLLTESTVIDYLRTRINQTESTINTTNESLLSSSSYLDCSLTRTSNSLIFSPNHLLPSTSIVDEYDPLWLEFVQSLNTVEQTPQQPTTVLPTTTTFASIFGEEDDDDDDEFIGPEDEHYIEAVDKKKLRVSKRELALLLKESTVSPDDLGSCAEEELLRGDQYESLWTDFLASLQKDSDVLNQQQQDEQQGSIITTTEEDDNDDPEFRLADTDFELEDDLGDELHVSKRELALLLEDNASLLTPDEPTTSDDPQSVASGTSHSTITITKNSFNYRLTSSQRDILQYQLTAVCRYIQLLTQYILLRRENQILSNEEQPARQLFNDLIYFRNSTIQKQTQSLLDVPILIESERLLESSIGVNKRKPLGNHLPFYLMHTFCNDSAFMYDSLLPNCRLSGQNFSLQLLSATQTPRAFVSGEDCLMALGLEQGNAKMLIIGHNDNIITDRLNCLRYARVRRGKQNPVKAFFTYGSFSDSALGPWYQIPAGHTIQNIYPNGLIEKPNVLFPSWFRSSYKRSRQLSKRDTNSNHSLLSSSEPLVDESELATPSTVYVVVEGSSSNSTTVQSPSKVLQQIHMLHLLNSYPKLQPKQQQRP